MSESSMPQGESLSTPPSATRKAATKMQRPPPPGDDTLIARATASPKRPRRAQGLGQVPSWLLLLLAALLAALAVTAGLRQAPHPDAGRALSDWDVLRADWWAYPLERHAVKRVVVQGHLDGLYVMPDASQLWAVGTGGLVLHSDDSGRSWVQQHPSPATPAAGPPRAAAAWSWIGAAQAAVPAPPTNLAAQQAAPSSTEAEKNPPPSKVQQNADPKQAAASPRTANAPVQRPASAPAAAASAAAPPASAAAPINPLTADLHAVAFTGARRGWAVGDGGTVLATIDGGQRWSVLTVPAGTSLRGIRFAAGGSTGVIADGQGPVLVTRDGGIRWERADADPVPSAGYGPAVQGPAGALAVHAMAGLQQAWAVDRDGSVWTVDRDSASGWSRAAFNAGAPLRAVAFDDAGQRGWAVGDFGTVIATRDGGKTWFRQTAGITAAQPGRYARYPAPWTWPVALGALLLLGFVMRQGFQAAPVESPDEAEVPPQVLPALTSDQPLTDLKDDRLGYRGSVMALSDFMRNSGTDPKLTLAITAPWGMGKTSMMGMLRGELRKWGFRSAWFNAWHHQQEGRRPLTALFNTISAQAVPSIWREPAAAVRVRSRLLWGRGWAYRLGLLLVGVPLVVLIAADLDKGRRASGLSLPELLEWNFVHHWLQEPRVAITPASLALLAVPPASAAGPAPDPCAAGDDVLNFRPDLKLRPAVYCYIRNALVAQGDGRHHLCNDRRPAAAVGRCVFASREALIDTIDASLFGPDAPQRVLPSERAAIIAAAEVIPPPPLLPTVEHLLPLMALLGLLLTKGLSVYGLELFKPLTRLFAKGGEGDGGNEPSGTIERYRREFCLLTEALDGRLVVFIDDLDRCEPETINSLLEMSNYLIDHGSCFIVLGTAMEQVKQAIPVPAGHANPEEYRNEYLRKLVHIELPVPQPDEKGLTTLIEGHAARLQPHANAWDRLKAWLWGVGRVAQRHAGWVLALTAGVALATAVADLVRRPDVVDRIAMATPAAAAAGAMAAQASAPQAASTGRAALAGPVGVQGTAPGHAWLAWFAGLGALVLSGAWGSRQGRPALQALTVALGGVVRTEDSDSFRRALALWRSAVRSYDATPRGLKRFCNRARLFSIVERLAASVSGATPEHHVVALTAMHHVSPEVVGKLTAAFERNPSSAESQAWTSCDWPAIERFFSQEGATLRQAWELLLACLKQHAQAFGGLPEVGALQRFNALLGQISVR